MKTQFKFAASGIVVNEYKISDIEIDIKSDITVEEALAYLPALVEVIKTIRADYAL